MQHGTLNIQSLLVGLVALLAVVSYAFMVVRSTRHAVIATLVVGAAAAFVAVVFGTIVLPYITFQPAPSPGARPYTDMEKVGRAIYLREGCYYCHTQFVRQQDRDLGPVAEAGDFVYDSPHALGTERTGPDLSNEGGKFPDEWHQMHISHPTSVRPGSVMPSFAFLMDRYPVKANNERWKYFDSKYQTWRDATDMDCLVVFIQSLGRRNAVSKEKSTDVPWEYRFAIDKTGKASPRVAPNGIPYASRQIIQGAGLYNQFCAPCHGLDGKGDGFAGRDMWIPPANFTLPRFAGYSDAKWFWRVSEGIPGAQMPRWMFVLKEEQRWYLIRFLQYINAKANLGKINDAEIEKKLEDLESKRLKADAGDRKGVINPQTADFLLFTPAPPGANPGGVAADTLPVELYPAALRTPNTPSPAGMVPTISQEYPGVPGAVAGIAPGSSAGPTGSPTATASGSAAPPTGAMGTGPTVSPSGHSAPGRAPIERQGSTNQPNGTSGPSSVNSGPTRS